MISQVFNFFMFFYRANVSIFAVKCAQLLSKCPFITEKALSG